MHGEELLIIGIAILAGGWCLIGPILWFVLLLRVKRIESDAKSDRLLRRELEREVAGLRQKSAAPTTAGGQAAGLVERMEALRKPQAEPPPVPAAPRPEPRTDIWVEEESVAAAVGGTGGLSASVPAATSAGSKRPVATETVTLAAESKSSAESSTWEEILAGKWLTWVGAIAIVIGAGLFFKYTLDRGLIGPTGRVVIGIIVGMGTFAGGAYAMLRNYRFLSQGLVGAALGILYFSLFAAFRWYGIVDQPVAFAGMVLVTVAGLAFAGYFNAQPTAILGLIGGFLTPIMLSKDVDAQVMLFAYILILDLGVLGLAGFRKWPAVQVLAFLATATMWLGWFNRWYDPSKLTPTIVLMTAFFLLFALLAVWYNVLRRKAADPGDFFLILATPVLYFIGLYGVTSEKYYFLHGLMALALAGTYLGLGVFSLSRNPAGKNVVVSLGGIAASFLTLAVPLQLTGHWIAIAWAAESLLLVELGLRFEQPKLRYAGFGLLVVVQVILFQYVGETLDNPRQFDSRFTTQRLDPLAQESLPGVNMTPAAAAAGAAPAAATVPPPAWTDLFNGRSFSFLASAIALGVLAWEYRRRSVSSGGWLGSSASEPPATTRSDLVHGWLLAGVPLTILGMLLIETYAAGWFRGWILLSYLGTFEVCTAAVAFALVLIAVTWGPRWLDMVGLGVFALLALFLVVSSLATLGDWRGMWHKLSETSGPWSMFLINPRGMGFVAALLAAVGAYVIHRQAVAIEDQGAAGDLPAGSSQFGPRAAGLPVELLLGLFTFLTLLTLLTIEVYAQGVIRDWGTATALSITGVWAVYALAALVLGITYRASALRLMALGLLVLTTGKVFLYDVWHLSKEIRTVAFIGLGVALFATSFLYRRFRGRLREWMTPVVLAAIVPAAMLAAPHDATAQAPPATDSTVTELHQLGHRWPVDTKSLGGESGSAADRGLVKLTIPPELFSKARTDLADVRIFARRDGDTSASSALVVPFVLVRPRDTSRTVPRQVTLLNLSERAGHTEFLLDLGDAAETVNEIQVEVNAADTNYERAVQVFGADRRDADDWNLVQKSAYLLDVSRPGHQLRVGKLTFPQSRFHFYKVSIDNRDQPPLRIAGATVSDREQVFVPRREFEGKIVSQETDAEHKVSRVVIDVGHEKLPTLGLRLAIGFDGSFYRPVSVDLAEELLGDKTAWRSVASGHVYRIDRAGLQAASTELSYSESPGRFVRLTITNGDDRPIQIESATALGIDKFLVAERRSFANDAALSVAVYAGSERLSAPRYDLARTAGSINPDKLTELKLGALEPNPEFEKPKPPEPPWSEANKPLLWAITLGGVVVLGLLTAMLLMKAAKHGPTES